MKLILVLLAVIVTSNARKSPHGEEFLRRYLMGRVYIPKEILEDAVEDVVEIVRKNGYPIEEHRLQTEDKYFVTLLHISHGIHSTCESRVPVLLMHGLYGSAATWIIQGPGNALAYILAENCFDVWLGNARGTYLSRGTSETTDKFWDFSFHEIGYYDVAKMIDFIYRYSNNKKVHCVTHSQGSTALFVLTSTRPEYNDKILSITGMAPIAYMINVTNSVLLTIADFSRHKSVFKSFLGSGEFVPNFQWLKDNAKRFCDERKPYFPICENFIFQLGGIDPEAINMTKLPIYMGHEPGGGSANEILHHAQNIRSHLFRQFDHGVMKNIELYNSTEPPCYDLKKVTAPVMLYYGYNDTISVETSVMRLANEISNSAKLELVPYKPLNHLDFVYRIDAKNILYKRMINEIKKFS